MHISDSYMKKLHKVRCRLARECKAKVKELRAKYGIKRIYNDYYEPYPSHGPTKLHFRCLKMESECWFGATYSEKEIPPKTHQLLFYYYNFVQENQREPGELCVSIAERHSWVIATDLLHEEDFVDERGEARKELIKKTGTPILRTLRAALRKVKAKDQEDVKIWLRAKL